MTNEEELFTKGKTALLERLVASRAQVIEQLENLRDHYETGHNGRHPIPDEHAPLDALYNVMSGAILELEFIRYMAPDKHGRAELVNNIFTSLAFAAIPADLDWKTFHEKMLKGVDAFYNRQVVGCDEPRNRSMVVRTGAMIEDLERKLGKKPS